MQRLIEHCISIVIYVKNKTDDVMGHSCLIWSRFKEDAIDTSVNAIYGSQSCLRSTFSEAFQLFLTSPKNGDMWGIISSWTVSSVA
jgi:hypothetical protein